MLEYQKCPYCLHLACICTGGTESFRQELEDAAEEALSPVKPQGIGELIRGAEKP